MVGGLLLLVVLIVAVVWAVNAFSRPYRGDRDFGRDPSRPTATEILRERFARGEITEEQFEQAKKVLGPDR
ncbi:MAG: electron transporter RnfE [Anaerolinea sp.]|nr:electron transporter RnfE [Anaerolinea sp.]